MSEKTKVVGAVYQKIALNIAENIINGRYQVGDKLYGRSTLASLYNVSPETIRKAVHILKDMEIVSVEKGSGIEVVSYENAQNFYNLHQETESLNDIKLDIFDWMHRQKKENAEMMKKINAIIDITERNQGSNPFTPFELVLGANCPLLNKTVAEINFWHLTEATIIGIKRKETTILSPGPYLTFLENDLLYFVGSTESYLRSKSLLDPSK